MSDRALTVFVSSTWIDLQSERAAILDLTHRLSGLRFAGMEFFGSRHEATDRVSLKEVDTSDLYVGVIGARYGSGITEQEYSRARERCLPCFLYFKRNRGINPPFADAEADSDSGRQLAAFRHRLREHHTCSEFDTPDELALKLASDLHNWLLERHLARGLSRLSTEYVTRVQAFVEEYVGGPDRQVPFGGRAEELAQLTEWHMDP